jgi:hypothetical protein
MSGVQNPLDDAQLVGNQCANMLKRGPVGAFSVKCLTIDSTLWSESA